MYKNKSVSAVILAAGRGRRMGTETNKVYLQLCDQPILFHTLQPFLSSDIVDKVVIVYNSDDRFQLNQQVLSKLSGEQTETISVVRGAKKRQHSSLNGVQATETDYVLVHDGARPNITTELIRNILSAAVSHNASIPGVRPVDTIREMRDDLAGESLDRDKLVRVQTPQAFHRSLLLSALDELVQQQDFFTDDAGAVRTVHNIDPKIVKGDKRNIKITVPDDLELARSLVCNSQNC